MLSEVGLHVQLAGLGKFLQTNIDADDSFKNNKNQKLSIEVPVWSQKVKKMVQRYTIMDISIDYKHILTFFESVCCRLQ